MTYCLNTITVKGFPDMVLYLHLKNKCDNHHLYKTSATGSTLLSDLIFETPLDTITYVVVTRTIHSRFPSSSEAFDSELLGNILVGIVSCMNSL